MSDLRQLLRFGGEDEAVSVNQRALIEKILARYSGEFTYQRELMQNANDAEATCVEFHFQTTASSSNATLYDASNLPNLSTHIISNIMVRNNGKVFVESDWNRLKKIAEGNPDEAKIGAFGVGFYSLFSICDDPLVSSGDKLMGFYWKGGGDQLYVKIASNSKGSEDVTSEGKPWTTFLLALREPTTIPDLAEFGRFLTTCLGFTSSIQTISVHFDGHELFKLSKTLAFPRSIPLNSNLPSTSPLKILKITNIDETPLQIKVLMSKWMSLHSYKTKKVSTLASVLPSSATNFASRMLSAFSSKSSSPAPSTPSTPPPTISNIDPFSYLTATLFLRIVSGSIKVSAPTSFNNEILRSTKKPLPKTTIFSFVWCGKDEFDARTNGDEDASRVFGGLISSLSTNGRVFIGFPTFQSTGYSASISARFISTVERESIDFQDVTINKWNRELLSIGGILARTIYEEEFLDIAKQLKQNSTLTKQYEERSLHLMKFFTFSPSTPSPVVSSETEISFFSQSKVQLTLPSQIGPLPANQVRISNPQLSGFIHSIPTVPQTILEGVPNLVTKLRQRSIVLEISFEDILKDLSSHPLTIPKAVQCFTWFSDLTQNNSYDSSILRRLKDAAMLIVENPNNKEDISIFPLGSFTTYINPKIIDEPLPSTTLPFALSKFFTGEILSKRLGFEELSIVEWTKYLVSSALIGENAPTSTNIVKSPEFAEKVLNTLAKGFSYLSSTKQNELVSLLQPHSFIPTSHHNQQLATAAYFSNVTLFDDLPIVSLPSKLPIKPTMEKLLVALGVRRHVELQLVFTRLLGSGGNNGSNYVDVIKYLVSVRSTLTVAEFDRLRKTAWLPKEGEVKVEDTDGKKGKIPRYNANVLFEPTEIFRSLGLPLLEWTSTQKWRSGSDEAKLLFELGLLRTPSVIDILTIAADASNSTRQEIALTYFLNEYQTGSFAASYLPNSIHDLPFIPALKNDTYIYAKPSEVFTNQASAILGFYVLAPRMIEHASRLKLATDPNSEALVNALIKNPPQTTAKARTIFSYLSTQVSRFSKTDISTLSVARIIPFETTKIADMRLPNECYFNSNSSLPKGLREIFPSIPDFGSSSKPFLTSIGVRDSPSPLEISNKLISDPPKFLELCSNTDNYLDVLRLLAVNFSALPTYVKSKMKSATFFLGTQRIASTSTTFVEEDDEEDGGSFIYALKKPSDIVVNDSPQLFRSFDCDLFSSPQDDLLENFVLNLGASKISNLVKQDIKQIGEPQSTAISTKLSKIIKERTYLFISERLQTHPSKNEITHSDSNWIKTHLEVFELTSIELSLSMTISNKLKRYSQPISAFANLVGGKIHLFVSNVSGPIDYFEVASAIVPYLISRQRTGDTLLFSVVLSTSLKELQRRGINVTRILNNRKQQQIQAEKRLKEDQLNAAQVKNSQDSQLESLIEMFPDADQSYLRQVLQSQPPPQLENAVNTIMNVNYPKAQQSLPVSNSNGNKVNDSIPSPAYPPVIPRSNSISEVGGEKGSSLMSRLQKKLGNSNQGKGSTSTALSNSTSNQKPEIPNRLPSIPDMNGKNLLSQPPTSTTGESAEGIQRNITKAIRDSRPENSNSIASDSIKSVVKEAESYCDASAAAHLNYVSDIAGLRFFSDKSISNVPLFVQQNQASIERFSNLIIKPIGLVFEIDPRSLHIFHDLTGPLIAFNRSGSIFINHRFYLASHDIMVKNNDLNEALISTYHTVAHELAHNLVGPHNSEHSFYFSTLCEKYFLRMSQLLSLNEQ